MANAAASPASNRSIRAWLSLSLCTALVVTAVDAYLLERKKGFFTGGFLADEHLQSWGERLAFLGLSWLSDAAFVGAVAALAVRCLGPLRLGRATWLAAAGIAVLPLAIGDLVRFELTRYLGDAFDLSLMFELTGRSVSEVLAVAAAHLIMPLLVSMIALAAGALLAWRLARRPGAHHATPVGAPHWQAVVALVGLAVGVTSAARLADPLLDDVLRRKPSVDWPGEVLDRLSDVDRDGYGVLGRPADPAPFDGRIYPYAVDLPGNGVDENSVNGDMSPELPPYEEVSTAARRWNSGRHVVLVMLESVRADAVGATLAGRQVTPNLDAMAARGVSSQDAWSHNGYTVQSRHHVFTGSLANMRGGSSLIDDFVANGYHVGYVSGQDDTFGSAALGVGRERSHYQYTARDEPHRRYSTFSTPGSLAVPFTVVEEKVAGFLQGRDLARPVFLYVNYHDTHFPYHHAGIQPILGDTVIPQRAIGPDRAEDLRRMYLNTVANVDASIGRVLALARQALQGDIGVIVLSDHGESLYDEGFLGHGYALNEVQTKIPLLVENIPMVIAEPWGQVQLRDALAEALAADTGGPATPRAISEPGRGIFQYLGGFGRPRQVVWRTSEDIVAYDVRVRRASVTPGEWLRESSIPPGRREAFVDLIDLWERMRLAVFRARAGGQAS